MLGQDEMVVFMLLIKLALSPTSFACRLAFSRLEKGERFEVEYWDATNNKCVSWPSCLAACGYHSESRCLLLSRRPQAGRPVAVVQVTPDGLFLYWDATIAESWCEVTFGEMRDLCLANLSGRSGRFSFFFPFLGVIAEITIGR